jgi:hypothetical protein
MNSVIPTFKQYMPDVINKVVYHNDTIKKRISEIENNTIYRINEEDQKKYEFSYVLNDDNEYDALEQKIVFKTDVNDKIIKKMYMRKEDINKISNDYKNTRTTFAAINKHTNKPIYLGILEEIYPGPLNNSKLDKIKSFQGKSFYFRHLNNYDQSLRKDISVVTEKDINNDAKEKSPIYTDNYDFFITYREIRTEKDGVTSDAPVPPVDPVVPVTPVDPVASVDENLLLKTGGKRRKTNRRKNKKTKKNSTRKNKKSCKNRRK